MADPILAAWLGTWRAMQRYHRYRVEGLEHLEPGRAALIVAYHGRPIALDQCLLSVTLHDRDGVLPHGVVHRAAFDDPRLRRIAEGLGFVAGEGPTLTEAVARGELIAVQPGGTREGCRSLRHRYRVDWGERTGFVRLAVQHGLPIVPVASSGVDDAWVGFNDGDRWGRAAGLPSGLPLWIGFGLGGLWPLSLPFPVRITTHIGAPLDVSDVDPTDPAALLAAQRRVASAVQGLLDRARLRAPEVPR